MKIGVLTLEIQLPGCKSLKEKRSRLKSLLNRLHREFNVSVAELDRLDKWDESTIGCVLISNDHQFSHNSLQVIINWVSRNRPDILLVNDHIEIIN